MKPGLHTHALCSVLPADGSYSGSITAKVHMLFTVSKTEHGTAVITNSIAEHGFFGRATGGDF